MKTYKVTVNEKKTIQWHNVKGQLHREDGPAIEYANGGKFWYINGKQLTEAEFNKHTRKSTCDGKLVEIDGKKYKLVEEK